MCLVIFYARMNSCLLKEKWHLKERSVKIRLNCKALLYTQLCLYSSRSKILVKHVQNRKNLVSISSKGGKNSKMNEKNISKFDRIVLDNLLQQFQQFTYVKLYLSAVSWKSRRRHRHLHSNKNIFR